MVYTANLGNNQQVTIINQGKDTLITLLSSTPGQQQSQTNRFSTGIWNQPPNLSRISQGFVLEIQGECQTHFILIQGNRIEQIPGSTYSNAIPVQLEYSTPSNQQQFEFAAMEPMQMGNMSMKMNPMSMQMGNMSMNIGENPTITTTKNFCSQCGEKVKPSDRFCSSCGYQLDS